MWLWCWGQLNLFASNTRTCRKSTDKKALRIKQEPPWLLSNFPSEKHLQSFKTKTSLFSFYSQTMRLMSINLKEGWGLLLLLKCCLYWCKLTFLFRRESARSKLFSLLMALCTSMPMTYKLEPWTFFTSILHHLDPMTSDTDKNSGSTHPTLPQCVHRVKHNHLCCARSLLSAQTSYSFGSFLQTEKIKVHLAKLSVWFSMTHQKKRSYLSQNCSLLLQNLNIFFHTSAFSFVSVLLLKMFRWFVTLEDFENTSCVELTEDITVSNLNK